MKTLIMLLTPFLLSGLNVQPVATITMQVPPYLRDSITPIVEEFEADQCIEIIIVDETGTPFLPSPAEDIDAHFDLLRTYAQSADVLFVDSRFTLTAPAVRSGYLLDLEPLVAINPGMNIGADVYPAALSAVQVDGGLWALPAATFVNVLAYTPSAFDTAALPYPISSWTPNDLLSVVANLEDGLVITDVAAASVVLQLTETILDSDPMLHIVPDFSSPLLQETFNTWFAAVDSGYVQLPNVDNIEPGGRGAALAVVSQSAFDMNTGSNAPIPMPVIGIRPVEVQGFAVSRGTSQPELAYTLARFLAQHPQMPEVLNGSVPAWRNQWNDFAAQSSLTVEYLVVAQTALEQRSVSFALLPYLISAVTTRQSITELQTLAESHLMLAAARRQDVINVTVPEITSEVTNGITLKFALNGVPSPLPNEREWQQTIADFVAQDSQVGNVELSLNQPESPWDCQAVSTRAVPGLRETLIDLRPLIQADARFDAQDLITGILDEVTAEGQIVGYPLYIEPLVMFFNPAAFDAVGWPYPSSGWTFTDFVDTVRTLDGVFAPRREAGVPYLMLIAAAGGLPIQAGEHLPVFDFVSEQNIEAIRSVLDLAKAGEIHYDRLDYISVINFVFDPAIFSDSVGFFSADVRANEGYRLAAFPTGSVHAPVSYSTTVGVINKETPFIDACYRWLSFLSLNQQVFTAMPAWRSQFDEADISQGADAEAVYRSFDTLLSQPNAVLISTAGRIETSFIAYFLFQAFNAYVLDGALLEDALSTAQQQAERFTECVGGIDEMANYTTAVIDCAVLIDPGLETLFSGSPRGGLSEKLIHDNQSRQL